jgi:Zn finger protein HypA/HybF involved in hydrogenase expression
MKINEIKKIVSESKTINEVLTKLGKNTSSGGYKFFKKYITNNNIDISHFWTQKEIIENQFKEGKIKKISIDDMFTENSTVSRGTIKKRILKENIMDYKCVFCENDGTWIDKKISLVLDHINGINNDNRLENLRFLCPNCNSTLVTHCKGSKGYLLKLKKEEKKIKKRDYKPRIEKRKVVRPDKETLIKDVEENGYSATGRKYGVSDNAIRKWLNNYASGEKVS